jgi:hypothetical protein
MIWTAAVGLAFVVATIAIILGCYAAMRRLFGRSQEVDTKELASSVIFRISALHGLIIALVFAQEMADFQNVRSEMSVEVTAIADVYNDARRYSADAASAIGPELESYLETVIGSEWERLGAEGRLDPGAWAAWERVYETVLDLPAASPRETALRDHMLSRIHDIAEERERRAAAAHSIVDRMFWWAAVAGVVFMSLGYYTFPPTRPNVILLCLFGAYTGIILYFIYAFSSPYVAPGQVSPRQFVELLEDIRAERGTPAPP